MTGGRFQAKAIQGCSRVAVLTALTTLAILSFSSRGIGLLSGKEGARPDKASSAEKERTPAKHALLIGCTKYRFNEQASELWGPANDVPKMAELLHKKFDFPQDHIKLLLGWPEEPEKRASYANIVAAFKDLINKAKPDDQIVILLSGHGTLIPISEPKKEQNWKANHLAFLPLDVKDWQNDRLPNALLDDELTDFLKQLRDKKASVLILFDCCHAGSMTRGEGQRERLRTVKPQDLGIPEEAIKTAVTRAKEGFNKEPGPGERTRGPALLPGGLGILPGDKDKGSLTAVYACQPFEEAPELPRPENAPQVRENYFGLLTYTLVAALEQQGQTLTYRELGQVLAAAYRKERDSRGPAPFLEGDLDRQVLGQNRWPGRSAVILEKTGEKLRVTAGALMGLTQGSILAVHPAAGSGLKADAVLGYLRVTRVFPGLAEVSPCDHGKITAVSPDTLPERSVCRLVERQLIEGLKLAVAKPTEEETKKEPRKAAARMKELAPAIAALDTLSHDEDFKDLIRLTSEETAEWLLSVEDGKVILWQSTGDRLDAAAEKERDRQMQLLGQPIPRRLFGGYPVADARAIKEGLQGDLQKIFTWRNVWRIAGAAGRGEPAGDQKLKLQVRLLENEMPAGELLAGAPVHSGQRTQLEIRNEGTQAVWLTLLLLDNDFGINVVSTTLNAGATLRNKGTLQSKTFGPEGVVVLALPLQGSNEPQYGFLAQSPLREVGKSRGERGRDADHAPKTPFGKLARTALLGKGSRAWVMDVDTNPVVLSWSWTTIPQPQGR